jgi:two-component system, NtrC family, nitrogen regulation sensor histidine kinase NtrY
MMSKNLYLNIVLYVLLITCTSVGMAFMVFRYNSIAAIMAGAVVLSVETLSLIGYLNKTNRRLAYFNNAIKNEDTSIKFPYDIKNKPVRDLYDSLNHINDIIRRTKIESAYNENLLKTLIEYSFTGFITIDESGNFNVMNNAARKYLNVSYTSNLERLKQNNPKLYNLIQTLRPGETKTLRIETNGERYELSISSTLIKYYQKTFRVVSMQDITKELDEQEMASWHKLFRVMTHEIMNSIAPITSLSQTLTRLYSQNGNQKQPGDINEKTISTTINGLKVIDEMSNGLMNFVQNYRQLNKIPKPDKQKMELEAWLKRLKTLITEMIRDTDIKFNILLSNSCRHIHADENLMNQVMLNLVKNAIEAVETVKKKEIDIHVNMNEAGRTCLTVADTGTGIAAADLDNIFIPFFTTKEHGNGIGLNLSKQILNLHGGNISIRSRENGGTSVMIVI